MTKTSEEIEQEYNRIVDLKNEGYKWHEIGTIMGTSANAARRKWQRGQRRYDDTPRYQRSEDKWEENYSSGTAEFSAKVDKKIKTLEEALEVCDADLENWEVERWVSNAWGVSSKSQDGFDSTTNYQVKIWFKKRVETLDEKIQSILPYIESYTPKKIQASPCEKKIGVVAVTDFHMGAEVSGLLKTKDFNIEVLIDYLHKAADRINSYGFSEVYLCMLGDFFESLSGINHPNTFKSLGRDMWGANVIIMANEIIGEHFLSRILNLKSISMVSGNHDRTTAANDVDNTGEGAKILWYMLRKDFPEIPIEYSSSVITKEIDGVNYLMTHGDKKYSNKDFSKFMYDYGKTGMFNMILEGHLHSRIVKKAYRSTRTVYEDIEAVAMDSIDGRKVVVPSLFTGNWYSESLGFTSSAGLAIFENKGSGVPTHSDEAI